jgi:hypothetical protein
MKTNSSAVETTKNNHQVIELTAEMEIPPERKGRIYDLTEALDRIVGKAPAAPQTPFPSQDDHEDPQSPEQLPEMRPVSEPAINTVSETTVPDPAIERCDAEIEPQPGPKEMDAVEQHLTADIGIPLEEAPEEEGTVLERYILSRYDADLDRMIDSVVSRAVHDKIGILMQTIS